MTLSRLCTVSWWTCYVPGMTLPLPPDLAMMSTHSTHPAEEYHTEEQQQGEEEPGQGVSHRNCSLPQLLAGNVVYQQYLKHIGSGQNVAKQCSDFLRLYG
ncbi:TPA: hypothetical protein ACH3X2_008314 [Trebouxia sp. C0005]